MAKDVLKQKLLELFTKEELAELLKDEKKPAVKKKTPSKVKKKPAARKKPQSKPKTKPTDDIPDFTGVADEIDDDDNDIVDLTGDDNSRSRPRTTSRIKPTDKACRIEPIAINPKRQNLFEKMLKGLDSQLTPEERKERETAKKLDKLTKARNKKRGFVKTKRPKTLCKVRCRLCGAIEVVSQSLVPNPSMYRCNSCCAG